MAEQPVSEPVSSSPASRRRRKFLAVVDKTPECQVAIRFATRRAQYTGGRVSLLCVAQHDDFQQWRGVEELIRDEAHREAETLIVNAAKAVNELSGILPELVILHGEPAPCLAKLISEDRDISILVLAVGSAKQSAGPLISSFLGGSTHRIPVTLVPGGLSEAEIDALT
ncbi:MAG: universal stress protein [Alphaproteobacteria bacterium]|jgi:nucleotide-binding universal stress UspA family protein|nr:universal stress protein [Alphaproteobacteria bacterium]